MIITIILSLVLFLLVLNYYMIYYKNRYTNLLSGPPPRFLIGNTWDFLGSRKDQWNYFIKYCKQYYPIFKVREFFYDAVVVCHPDDLEIILNTTKHIKKSFFYDVLKPWLRTGLLTSGGTKWHLRRKILTPTFHFNILQQFVENLIEEGENMTKSLQYAGGSVVKDLVPFVSEYTLNAICETAMGISLQSFNTFQQQQYRDAVHRMGELFIHRISRPWLYNDWIFWFTPTGREQNKILKILHGFTKQIIAERKLYHEQTNDRYLQGSDTSAEKNDTEQTEIRKKRLAMLDFLIAASRQGLMTDSDIAEEVDTFMFEGHDTTAMGLCFTMALLAEHKDIQDRVRNEIGIAMQKNGGKFSIKLLQDLPYLERCIKESLRLYPSVFVISRILGEDVKLHSYFIPAGTMMILNIYLAHRAPSFWPNPEVFDPDRFLADKIRNRHPYSYIPFSAGPRNCIGQRFAMLEMKAIIAPVIHHFYLEPIDYLKNIEMNLDFILRPANSLRVKFIPIC